MTDPIDVRHAPERQRFEVEVDGRLAELDYVADGRVLRLHHTLVPAELEGRGIASALVQAAVDHVRAEGLTIQPLCSYVRAWLARHPEHADVVAG